MTGLRIFLGAAILGGLGAAAPFTPLWLISLVTLAMSTGLVVCGLIILWRGGLVPFGQALFFATGAYTVALSGRWFGVTDAFLLIALAVIMAALVAFVVGFLLAQYREIFFAMLSLALSMILYGVLVKSETLGSTDGINVAQASFFGMKPRGPGYTFALFWLALGMVFSAWLGVSAYLGSVAGQLAGAIRDNEIRVEYLGISVTRLVHLKLTISAALAGAGGALGGAVDQPCRSADGLLDHVGRICIRDHPGGCRIGSGGISGGAAVRDRPHHRGRLAARRLAIDPRIGTAADDPVRARGARLADDPQTRHRFREGGGMSALLSVKGLEKTFGQVVAARDINVDVPQGQTVGIIGANGAGKTTFVNMITGHLTPSGGTIQFEGRDITGLPSRKIMRLGIARSFQVAQVFPTFSVFENLCAATAIARSGSSVVGAALSRFVSAETSANAETALDQFQIAQFRDALASTLPQGVRKLLDIAMATAGNPRVLLLDEPTSGISLEEKFGLMDVIMGALKARGTTILFVEHDMEIVQRFADRVLAFYDGTVIADGSPAEALGDERVREFITGTLIRSKDGKLNASRASHA